MKHGVLAEFLGSQIVAEFQRAAGLCQTVHIPDGFSKSGALHLGDGLILAHHDHAALPGAEIVNAGIFAPQPGGR